MATAVRGSATATLPEGVVTFLLTDVEGSSRLWERDEAAMVAAIALHDELVERAVAAAGGVRPVEQGEGDSVVVAFTHASQAVACALGLQRALAGAEWPPGCELRVRMALHSGEARLRDAGNYAGAEITRCARLRAIAHGGQTLMSRSTFELVAQRLPEGSSVRPLGLQRLRDLARPEEVFELVHPAIPSGFPPPRSLDALPNNLPVQLTSFIGREREVADVSALLADRRLVTLTGAGGCGKTRLALQVAAEGLEPHPDGAWWVDLAPLSDPGLVVGALATALGLRELPGQDLLETVGERLLDRRALVVLDNCEHVVVEAARVCEALLRACPELSLLATSREPLGAEGEATYRVPSLAVPAPGTPLERAAEHEAVRLFVERARASRPQFDLTAEICPAVVSICTRLDGMPLALELAAARTRMLSPEQIAEGLGSRFGLLAGGRRTAVPRQQTLEHSIDWSYELLDEYERTVLCRASVFAGGFDLAAGEAVCAGEGIERYAVLDLLSRLVDKSLVQVDDATAGCRRYRLLETIRQYAAGKLVASGRGAATRSRHLEHYLALAEEAAPAIEGHDQLIWLDRLEREHDNLRAAADWATACSDADREARLAGAMCFFWAWRGYLSEGRERAESALASGGGEPRVRGMVLLALADTTLLSGDFGAVNGPAQDALAIGRKSQDPWLVGRALGWIGWSEAVTGGPGAATTFRRAAEASREAGDIFCLSFTLNALGFLEYHKGNIGAARDLLGEALALGRECGNRKAMFMPLVWSGLMLTDTGEFRAAQEALREGLELARELQDPLFIALHLGFLAVIDMHAGDYQAARKQMEDGVAKGREHRNPLMIGYALATLAWLDAWTGDPRAAVEEVEQALTWGQALGLRRYTARWRWVQGEAAHLAEQRELARRSWQGAVDEGRDLADPWALGQGLHGLALVAADDGEPGEAERLAREALAMLSAAQHRTAAIDVLESLAGLYLGLGAAERAARLLGATEAERARRGQVRPPALERRHAVSLERLRSDDLAAERTAGAAMTLEDAVAYALRGRGSRERPDAGWDSLTPAELQVAWLVADGLTNAQIGERLFISKRTVQAHLASVFRKLGASNRAEVAAEATRRASRRDAPRR